MISRHPTVQLMQPRKRGYINQATPITAIHHQLYNLGLSQRPIWCLCTKAVSFTILLSQHCHDTQQSKYNELYIVHTVHFHLITYFLPTKCALFYYTIQLLSTITLIRHVSVLQWNHHQGFNFISNNLLPPEINVFRNCLMLIHELWAVDEKEYYTCWLWTKMDMTFFLAKGRGLTVDENWHARGRKRILHLLVVDENGWPFCSRRVGD
jgi:hypothetical protein